MTDVNTNLNITSHDYTKKDRSDIKLTGSNEKKANDSKEPIDLGKDPAGVYNKAVIKTGKVKETKGALSEEDAAEIDFVLSLRSCVDEYKEALIQKGYDATAAEEKARIFLECLISHNNV